MPATKTNLDAAYSVTRFCIIAKTFGLALMLVCFSGCYPDWPEHAGRAVVQGEITMDDSPVRFAKVVFLPMNLTKSSELMAMAYGTTDVDGNFELAYSDGSKEVMAGWYTVIISKVQTPSENETISVEGLLPDSVRDLEVFNSFRGEEIPSIFNRNSTLKYEIKGSAGIIRPKFNLSSIDPALDDLPVIDLPIK